MNILQITLKSSKGLQGGKMLEIVIQGVTNTYNNRKVLTCKFCYFRFEMEKYKKQYYLLYLCYTFTVKCLLMTEN